MDFDGIASVVPELIRSAETAPPGSPHPRDVDRMREHLRKDPNLDVSNNLLMDVPLTVHEAMAGGSVEVPTPDGTVRVKIPAGVKGGERLRLRRRGMPLKDDARGDLYLILRPALPKTDDPEAIKLAEQLAAFHTEDIRGNLKF